MNTIHHSTNYGMNHAMQHPINSSAITKTAYANQNLNLITDDNLYRLCKTYGERARFWKQKFAGLLPEVFRRRLYEKKGFLSIFEFSKKLAGMSEEQVRLVLNLEKRFEKTPVLKSLLVNGEVSINKLARIVSIAKPENEIFLATQVQVLSKSAVETLVRDEKFALMENVKAKIQDVNIMGNQNGVKAKNSENDMLADKQSGLQKSFFEDKSLPGQTLQLSTEVHQKLLELQQKGIDINTLLLEFLNKREQEIAQRKQKISQKILKREAEKSPTKNIPTSVKRILQEEYGKKCSIKSCQKQAVEIHHLQGFSASKSHDPKYLIPLCKEHHELAHSADLAYHEIRQRIKNPFHVNLKNLKT